MAICSWRNSCRWVTVFKHDVVHSQYYSLPSRITCRPWRKEVSPPWSIRPLRKQALSQRRLFSDFKGIFWSVSSLLYWMHLSEYSSYDFNSSNLSFSESHPLASELVSLCGSLALEVPSSMPTWSPFLLFALYSLRRYLWIVLNPGLLALISMSTWI